MLLPHAMALLALASFAYGTGPILVPTTSGPVRGVATDKGRYWKGIPYATPPVGNMRWQNPMPASIWTQPKDTSAFGPACPQDCNLPGPACQKEISEDCLYLNVYTPVESPSRPLPVMVFFHGGRYEQGAAGVNLFDGAQIANYTNTIVVTVNYRLGVLGFLTLPGGFRGNYGSLDQRLSLEWVHNNIAGFGGDRTTVTIFGQSAGATSVSFHLVSKGSWGLFQRVVVESSPYSLPLLKPETAYKHYEHFAAEANCTFASAGCLLNLTWQQVIQAEMTAQGKIYLDRPLALFFPWTPVVDGEELVDDPLTLINKGMISPDVDAIVLGNVAEEAWIFVFEAFGKLDRLEAIALVSAIFRGEHEPRDIFEMYPLPVSADDYRPWVSNMASDFIIVCSGRNVTNALNEKLPVYRYNFDHAWSVKGAWGPNYPFCDGHVCHGAELPFVFDSAAELGYNFTKAERLLSRAMATSWGNFAHTGNPNVDGVLPTWPRHYRDSDESMVFATNGTEALDVTVQNRLRAEFCNFWDQQGYIF